MMSICLEFEAIRVRFRLTGPIGRMGRIGHMGRIGLIRLIGVEPAPFFAGNARENQKASRDRGCGAGGVETMRIAFVR